MGVDAWGVPLVLVPPVPHAERTRANPAAIIDTGLRMLPPFLSPDAWFAAFSLFLALNKRLFYVRHGSNRCQWGSQYAGHVEGAGRSRPRSSLHRLEGSQQGPQPTDRTPHAAADRGAATPRGISP